MAEKMLETIEVRYSGIKDKKSDDPVEVYHKYIVYTDSEGKKHYARGGPSVGMVPLPGAGFGYVKTEHGEYVEGTPDWDLERDDQREIIKSEKDLSEAWSKIKEAMDRIEDGRYEYQPLGQNSNAVVDEALKSAGLPAAKLDDGWWSPGSDTPFGIPYVSDWPKWFSDWFHQAGERAEDATGINPLPGRVDPLVLDLDGDGVETSALGYGPNASATYFDMDNDGFAERTGWAAGGDGLLALDKNGNGKIDNQSELFANSATHTGGFAALSALDSNKDGKITSADAQWNNLRVWIDGDSDGVTDTGELKTLSSLKITQINLNTTAHTNVFNNGNPVAASSTFIMNGASRTISDVWFQNDQADARYMGNVALNAKTLFLPTLRGLGNIKDLHVAMSEDSSLLTMVENFAKSWSIAKFSDRNVLDADVRAILYKWAGVDTVSDMSRGPYVDAKKISFIEKITGQYWGGGQVPINPGFSMQASEVNLSFDMMFFAMKGQLIAQVGGSRLFDTIPYYDFMSGNLTAANIGSAGVALLSAQAAVLTADKKYQYWLSVSEFLLSVKSYDSYSATEKTLLNNAISSSIPGTTFDSFWNLAPSHGNYTVDAGTEFSDYLIGTGRSETIRGLGGNDYISGRGGSDTIYGGEGHDYVFGDAGDDYLYGDNGDDVLSGGLGNDRVYGGNGNDSLAGDDGNDYLYGEAGNDVVSGGMGNDTLYGGDGNDSLFGNEGNDYIYGEAGDDIITGGLGTDDINGGAGNDTYVFSPGDSPRLNPDRIYDYTDEGIDTIKLTGGILPEDVFVWVDRQNVGLMIIQYTANDRIYVQESARTSSNTMQDGVSGIEKISFDNGTVWDFTKGFVLKDTNEGHVIDGGLLNDTIYGNGGDDYIFAGAGNDLVNGGAGNDTLYGEAGNDTLIGGTGFDILNGGVGDDTYSFAVGDSSLSQPDIINFYEGEGTDTIRLTGGILPQNITLIQQPYYTGVYNLQYSATDKIQIKGWRGTPYSSESADVYVSKIAFDNGTVLNFSDLLSLNPVFKPTSGNDTFNASAASSGVTIDLLAGNDVFTGSKHNDMISGGAGNDTLAGGLGVDTLNGNAGDDTYVFSAGDSPLSNPDIIYDAVGEGVDTIKLTGGILPENVFVWTDAGIVGRMVIQYTPNDQIVVQGLERIDEYTERAALSPVERIVFDNGTVWDFTKGYPLKDNNEGHRIIGGNLNDTIYGNGGNDQINSGGGNDLINGGSGNDILYGEAGNDTLIGGTGSDILNGGVGDDIYSFAVGDSPLSQLDVIDYYQGEGTDTIRLTGGILPQNVTVWKEPNYAGRYSLQYSATDKIQIQGWKWTSSTSAVGAEVYVQKIAFDNGTVLNFADLLSATPAYKPTSGNDTINASAATSGVTIDLLAGNDVFTGSKYNDTIQGGAGADTLNGGAGNDTYNIAANSGLDTITDSSGSDKIVFGTGITQANTTYARSGNDLIISVSGTQVAKIVNHFVGTGAVETLQFSTGTTVNLTTLTFPINGTSGNDTLTGTAAADTINGLAGNDTLSGGAGTDTLNGGDGNDTYNIAANNGLDTITDSSGSDKIVFGTGIAQANTTYARSGNDLIISVSGTQVAKIVNHFVGTGAVETLQFSTGTTVNLTTLTFPINGTSGNDTLTGTAAADTINGLAGNDTLNGGAGNDSLYGGDGNDTLYGQGGSDTLRGEAGNDIYVYYGGQDKIYETSGTDTLSLSSAMTVDALVFSNVGSVDTKMTFSSGNDITLYGQRGTNNNLKIETVQFADGFSANLTGYQSWKWGSTAAQTTNGTASADTILGRGGNDTINGLAGNDALHGGSGNDTIKGGDGNDLVHGGIGNDNLYGDAGNDILYGDDGLDNLWGGAGVDTFMFLKGTAFKNIDVINDFSKSQADKINLKDLLVGYDPLTKAITDFVQITTSGSNSILKVDADGGANGFVQIATIKGVTGLTDEAALVASGNLVVS